MSSGAGERSAVPDTWTWRWRSGPGRHLAVIKAKDAATILEYIRTVAATAVVLDIEPGLIHWTASSALLSQRLTDFKRHIPRTSTVILCTNSRRFNNVSTSGTYVGGARKPWTGRGRFGSLGDRPVVVGDSLLIDGLLALRLRAAFVWLQWQGQTPPWPRMIHVADRLAGSVLLATTTRE